MNRAIPVAVALALVAVAHLYLRPADEPREREPATASATTELPTYLTAVGDTPETHNIANNGSEVVLGLRVRQERNCTVELNDYVTPDGEMFSAYSCTPNEPAPDHPYAHYDDDSLEALAWADSAAAALLGRRLVGTDHGKAYAMLVRATALGGDTRHLAWLADQAFSAVRSDGELRVGNVMRRYELAALATEMGADPAPALHLRNELMEAGIGDAQFATLERRTDALLEIVRDIQRAVYGEVRYGGQDDA